MTKNLPIRPEDFGDEVRFTEDNQISVLDGIQFSVGCSRAAAKKTWERLQKEYPGVVTNCHYVQFPDTKGRLNKATPVANLQIFLEILVILPGRLAARVRREAVRTLIRALNGDVSLVEEIIERINNSDDLHRIEVRARGKQKRIAVTATWQAHGVTEGWQFGYCTNRTYEGLYNTDASGLKEQMNLSTKANPRDHMSTQGLIELAFTEDLIDRKVRQDNPNGYKACGKICLNTARKVSDFTKEVLSS